MPTNVRGSCTDFSSTRTRTSDTVLRDIQGPAGRLEALLQMPASRGITSDGLAATGAEDGIRGAVVFGSWIGLNVGVVDPRVSALIGIAAPVNRWDFEAVAHSTTPKFFIHGEQ